MNKTNIFLLAIFIAIISFSINTYACDNSNLATTNTNLNVSETGKGTLKCTITFDDHYYNIDYNTILQIEDSFNKSNISNVTELYIYTSKVSNCNCTNIELLLKFNSISNLNSKLKTVFESIGCNYNTHSTIKSSIFICNFSDIDSLNFAIDSILLFDAKLEYETKYPLYTIQFNKTTKAYTLEDIINNSTNAGIKDINDYVIKITSSKKPNNNTKEISKTNKNKPTPKPTTTTIPKKIKLTPVKTTTTSTIKSTTSPNITLDNVNNYNDNNIEDNTKLIILLSIILLCITIATVFYIVSRKKA